MELLLFVLFVLIVVLLLVFIVRLSTLTRDLATLRRRLDVLEAGRSAVAAPPPPAVPAETLAAPTPTFPRIEVPPPPSVPRTPSRTREEWEALVGGKLLNRIGALALIIGVGFFLKYAFDNNWLSETVRVILGAATGAALLTAAGRSHARGFAVFAQGLVGAGVSILYLSVYASFNFYHLVSQPVAFVLMAAVTVVTLWQAFRYDSLAISMFAWAGGFLTPVMLSTGHADEIGLFSYLILLDAGLLTIAVRKQSWAILQPLTFLGTAAVFFSWYVEYSRDANAWITGIFVALFWAIFVGAEILAHPDPHDEKGIKERGLSLLVGVSFYGTLIGLVLPDGSVWKGTAAAGIAAFYGVSAFLIRARRREARQLWSWHGLLCAVFIAAAIDAQFSGEWVALGWSIASLAILWIATDKEFIYVPRAIPFLLFLAFILLAARTVVGLPHVDEQYQPLFNPRALAFLVLAASFAASSRILERQPDRTIAQLPAVLEYLRGITLFLVLTAEVNDAFRHWMLGASNTGLLDFQRWMTFGAAWSVLGLLLSAPPIRRGSIPLLHVALGLMLLGALDVAIRGMVFEPLTFFVPVWNWRVLCMLVTFGSGLVQLRLRILPEGRTGLSAMLGITAIVTALLPLFLLTGETRDLFRLWISRQAESGTTTLTSLENAKQLSLSAVWLVYSIAVMALGLMKRLRALRVLAIVLFGLTILKVFFYDLSFLETLYRIFSFIGLGIILLLVSYLYQRNKDIILGSPSPENRPK